MCRFFSLLIIVSFIHPIRSSKRAGQRRTRFYPVLVGLGIISIAASILASPPPVTLTIFNRDLVQYREIREVELKSGSQSIEFLQPLPRLLLSSLLIEPVVKDAGISAVSTEFLPEGVDFASVWALHVGKMVGFQQGSEFFHGKLLRVTDTHIYLQPDTTQTRVAIIDKNMLSTVSFDSLPVAASGPSRIIWKVTSPKSQTVPVRIRYLAPGANWRAAYHLWLTGDKSGIIQGVYSIENTTSREFQQVQVELIAGDPMLGSDEIPADRTAHTGGFLASNSEWNGYERYQLPQLLDLPPHQSSQSEFLRAMTVAGTISYLLENATLESAPVVREFEFSLGDNHPQAMPWGEITVYGDTVNGGSFIGEDYIGPASAGSKIKVHLGVAFDVTAKKERLRYERKSRNEAEEAIRITIANATNRTAIVTVREPVYGSWKLLSSNISTGAITPSATDATSLEWKVTMPAQTENYVEYTVEKNR